MSAIALTYFAPTNFRWGTDTGMRVEQYLNESATRFAKQPAIVASGRSHSYADLARSSDRVAVALVSHGIRRGDRVAIFMDDTFEAVVSAFAVLKAGGVASPVQAGCDAVSLAAILSRTAAAAIVTEARLASVAAAAIVRADSIKLILLSGGDRSTANASCLIFEDLMGGIGPGPRVERAGPASDAAILFHAVGPDGPAEATTTLTHTEVIAAAARADLRAPAPNSILGAYGLSHLLAAIKAGATLVLETPSVFRRPGSTEAAVPALA